MIIAIDFDGTIVEHNYPKIGSELPNATYFIKKIKNEFGIKIILWTCREGQELAEAVDWCKSKGLVFDAVNSNIFDIGNLAKSKIYADLYIDDRNFGTKIIDWNYIYKFFRNMHLKNVELDKYKLAFIK